MMTRHNQYSLWFLIATILMTQCRCQAPVYPPTYPPPSPTSSPAPTAPLPPLPQFSVRIANGPNNASGRVEVFHENSWGTVCDDGFDANDALVVCKALGFSSGRAVSNATYGEGVGYIWMSELSCRGNETSLVNCNFGGWGISSCTHAQDVGVICSNETAAPIIVPSVQPKPVASTTLKPISVQFKASVTSCSFANDSFKGQYQAHLTAKYCSSGKCYVEVRNMTCTPAAVNGRRLLADAQLSVDAIIIPTVEATAVDVRSISVAVTTDASLNALVPTSLSTGYGITPVEASVVDPNNQPSASSKKKDNSGMIAGAVIGSIVGAAIIAAVAVVIYVRTTRSHSKIAISPPPQPLQASAC